MLEYHTENVFKYIDKSLQNNESPILCRDSYLKESKHAVNILGKDSEYISYFENGKDVYINSLIDVYHELFIKKFTNFNTEFFDKYNCKEIKIFLDNNFIKLSLNDESILKEYKTLIQNFLGYSKNNKILRAFLFLKALIKINFCFYKCILNFFSVIFYFIHFSLHYSLISFNFNKSPAFIFPALVILLYPYLFYRSFFLRLLSSLCTPTVRSITINR